MRRAADRAELKQYPVRVRVRGGRTARGDIHAAAGQSLVAFLVTKKSFLNLTSAVWENEGSARNPFAHLALNIREVAWVEPLDAEMSLSTALSPSSPGRRVELHLVGGEILDVTLHISEEMRMSNYFESNPGFVPLWGVKGTTRLDGTGRIAVHHTAIEAIREV
jgi:hypothetical protein